MNLFEAKRKFRFLYKFSFEDKTVVVFRLLSWSEFKTYRELLFNIPSLEQSMYEDIFSNCIVDASIPHTINDNDLLQFDLDSMPAGIVETISSVIYRLSGANNPEELFTDIDNKRDFAITDTEKRILSAVCSITKYRLEDFDNMYWPDVLDIITQSELLISGNIPSVPFIPLVEEKKTIDFDKENKEDAEMGVTEESSYLEARRERTRQLRKQNNIR